MSLYNEELILPDPDEDTGAIDLPKEDIAAEVEELAPYESLLEHPGFKLVQAHIGGLIAELSKRLLKANDFDSVRRLQEQIHANMDVLSFVKMQAETAALLRASKEDPSK